MNLHAVFICSLDVEKAFNRINHHNFLTVLINRVVSRNFVILFYKWISSLSFCVLWNNILSCTCNISSDLLQGNILSSKFFNAYMDKLLYKLEESGLGCKLYKVFCGILMYADDILLLCSSITKLQLMVEICVSFGIEMAVKFSLLKSNCLAIYPSKIHLPSLNIQLGGNSLNWYKKLRYIGIFITNNSKNLFDLNKQIDKFYAAIHSVISNCSANKELVALEILKRK